MEKLKPKLFSVMKNYSFAQFGKDFVSGIIVAVIALPLSIAQTVAKNHKGKITVASEVGYFAEFCLILPLDLNKKSNIQSVKKYIQEFLTGEKK